MDSLIKEFIDLLQKCDNLEQKNKGISVLKDKERFENDFVALNCEIQQIRSENETLIDEIKNKVDHVTFLDQEIQEKSSLIHLLETKISEIKI